MYEGAGDMQTRGRKEAQEAWHAGEGDGHAAMSWVPREKGKLAREGILGAGLARGGHLLGPRAGAD